MGSLVSEIKPENLISHPTYKWATFAVISALVDLIIPQTLIDSIGIFTDIMFGGFGDNFAFEVKPRDLFTVTKSGRGKRRSEVHKQFDGQVTIVPVEHDMTVQVSLYKVLAGKESLAEFVMKAARSLETQMTYDAYDAFGAAMSGLETTGDDKLQFTGWSEDDAVGLALTVSSWNMGKKAVFMGTQRALANIVPTLNDNYRYTLDSDYVKLGYVRTFKGFDAMVLPQVADYTTPFKLKIDDTKIYVLSPSSGKLIKMAVEGSLISIVDEPYANANLTQSCTLKKNFASSVVTNSIAGVINLS